MTGPYVGYSGAVWRACYAALFAYQGVLADPTQTPAALADASETMLRGLINGVAAINAFNLVQAWTFESQQLASILTQPLIIDSTSLAYIENRLTAYELATTALTPLVPAPATFGQPGMPVIPAPQLIGFYAAFDFETEPLGLSQVTFDNDAQAVSTSFQNLANAIMVLQGSSVTQQYDIATREALVTGGIAGNIADWQGGGVAANFEQLNAWNQSVALPAMSAIASMITNTVFTQQGQQQAVIRYALISFMQQIALFLLLLRQPVTAQINVTTLRVGETLMDVAARALNDYEQWPVIASLNGLSPPYVGSVSTTGIAGWGTQLVLPAPGTSQASVGTVPSYEQNYLGTDVYFGPIDGDMPPWNGDYTLITGYQNLSWALGRRLITPLSSLIYHNDFGSRIPPEVGSIQTQTEALRIAAFGTSALLTDPRVASVQNAQANGTNNAISFSADVLPNGFGAQLTSVNEVISPLPAGSTR